MPLKKSIALAAFAAASLTTLFATEDAATPSPAEVLKGISDRMMIARNSGQPVAPADLAALDDLIAQHQGDTSDFAAEISLTKGAYLLTIANDIDAAYQWFEHMVATFPDSPAAEMSQRVLTSIDRKRAEEARAAQFIGQPAPELDFTWISSGETTHLSQLRGKVVVLDFWATWCGPCVRSFPQVRELTDHYAGTDVAVVGVTSLQGRIYGLEDTPIDTEGHPEREHALMADYIVKNDINWTIAFSEQEVFNDDYGVEGIPHMAIVAPDGTIRHTGLHPAMPHDQKVAMIDAILKEFDLPLPAEI